MVNPEPIIHFTSLTELSSLLSCEPPPLARDDVFRQLFAIFAHVEKMGCESVLVEERYIDRDYIEDFSAFYSRSFSRFDNACKRIHFFRLSMSDAETAFQSIRTLGREKDRRVYEEYCRDFSESSYLGFMVIKPLKGCPVVRTVLRVEDGTVDGDNEEFPGSRFYTVHVAGLELNVRGLAFQQQDVGVSACATTALWSSLHKARDFEDIRLGTPAQITSLASRYSLPFGRPMPSEGLNIDQMCQAVQALGMPAHLFKELDFENARAHLYSSLMSGFPPVLIVRFDQSRHHAITAVGMRLEQDASSHSIKGLVDSSERIKAVFVHDDRLGPYIPAKLASGNSAMKLVLSPDGNAEPCTLTHLLIPLHSKIRLSFVGLRHVALSMFSKVQSFRETYLKKELGDDVRLISVETTISLSRVYCENLVLGPDSLEPERAEWFFANVSLPRYVGIIRLKSDFLGCVELLVDSTCTVRNLNFLAILCRRGATGHTGRVLKFLSDRCGCTVVP